MQVSINGKPTGELTAELARRIAVRRGPDVCEGATLTLEEAVENAKGSTRILFVVAGGLGAILGLGSLGVAAAYEPGALVFTLPFTLVAVLGIGLLMRLVWRRNLSKAAARAEAQLRLMPPGEAVRVDATGLAVAGARFSWPEITVQELGVLERSDSDSTSWEVDRLTLLARGRSLVLDAQAVSNGRQVVRQAWRWLSAAAS